MVQYNMDPIERQFFFSGFFAWINTFIFISIKDGKIPLLALIMMNSDKSNG